MTATRKRQNDAATENVVNALSVDVEDWFQVENFAHRVPRDTWDRYRPRVEANTRRLLALFERHRVTATFFVLGWVAERFPGLVREIHGAGHEIACHSHLHRLVYLLSPAELRRDTRRAKALLEDITGEAVRGYRAPSYSITRESLWALDVLAELGFEYDSSIFPVRHDRYGIPDFPRWPQADHPTPGGRHIHEFPLTTVRVAGHNAPGVGGGYLRLLPMGWTHHAIRAANRSGHPAILYTHPWEIDADQPRISGLPPLTYLRCYANLNRVYGRLDEALRAYAWAPVREVLAGALGLSSAHEGGFGQAGE